MKATKRPKAAAGLSVPARKLWGEIQQGYAVTDPAGLAILTEALRSWDRAEAARREVDRAKRTSVVDRYGQIRPHPACAVERDSRAAFLSGLKALRVDVPTGPTALEED